MCGSSLLPLEELDKGTGDEDEDEVEPEQQHGVTHHVVRRETDL